MENSLLNPHHRRQKKSMQATTLNQLAAALSDIEACGKDVSKLQPSPIWVGRWLGVGVGLQLGISLLSLRTLLTLFTRCRAYLPTFLCRKQIVAKHDTQWA